MAKFLTFILIMLLLSTIPMSADNQTLEPLTSLARPVKKLPRPAPSSADIEFDRFEFARLTNGRYGPMPWDIEGEPSKGGQYFVQAKVYGHEAIATAKFELLDEQGAVIQPVPIVKEDGPSGSPEFFGMMIVPDRPFRVALSGEAVDGQRYQRIYERLFMPTDRPENWDSLIQGMSPSEAKKITQWAEQFMRQQSAKVKEKFEKLPGGVINFPRTRVFNVAYAPLLSRAGRLRGIRINYEVEFSETGYYNPELQVIPWYENEHWRGMIQMWVVDGKIEPEPEERGSPQVRPHLLAYDAGYQYLGQTVYRFTADLLPDYAIQNESKTKFCLYNQKFNNSPPHVLAAWRALLSSNAPTTYKVYIQNSDYTGVIENWYPQSVIYNGFAEEGATDCGVQPSSRF